MINEYFCWINFVVNSRRRGMNEDLDRKILFFVCVCPTTR